MLKRSAGNALLVSLAIIGAVLGVIFLYVVAHEGGHALAVLLFGGEVVSFEVNFLLNSPRIRYVGITNPMQQALISLAGPLFPLTLLFLFTKLLPKVKNKVTQGALLISVVSLLSTIVVSIFIALAHGLGAAQPSEDISKFLSNSGANPAAVAGAFALLLVVSVFFLLRVGKAKDVFLDIVKTLRNLQGVAKPSMGVTVFAGLALLAVMVAIVQNVGYQMPASQPASYQTKVHVDFGEIESGSFLFYSFKVEEPTTYDFVYELETSSEVTLRLVNLGGEPFPFNNQESMVMYQGNENLRQARFTGFTLLEGDYGLEIATNGRGFLTMHVDTSTPAFPDQQYLELLTEVNTGAFTADSYQEPGYQLLYQGEIQPGTDQLLVTIPSANYQRVVSAFVVGDYQEMSLVYVADGDTRTLLQDYRATIGYGLPVHKSQGEFRITAVDPSAQLYVYINGNR